MRRTKLTLVGSMLLLVLGAGCGADSDDNDRDDKDADDTSESSASSEDTEPSESPETPEASGPAYGEEISVDIATVMTVQEPTPGAPGRIDVELTATNTGLSDGSIDLFLACAGNYNTGKILIDASTPTPVVESGTVPPDTTVEGFVSLDLPTYQDEVVDSCEPGQINLVVPGFAGQDVVYPLSDDLADHLLAGP